MAEEKNSGEGGQRVAQTRHRSPNYPMMNLREAVERVEAIHKKFKRASVPANLAHAEWGYKAQSSLGKQAVGALRAYGLIEVEGSGEASRMKVSDLAYRILLGSSDRPALLKKAALNPSLHTELWEKFGGEHFADDSLIKHYLLFDRVEGTFNAEAVDRFIANFRATLDYASLLKNGKISEEKSVAAEDQGVLSVSAGDYVQWTSAGVDQFSEPLRVTCISDDGQWAFIEGKFTGVPVNELSVQQPKGDAPQVKSDAQPPLNPFYRPPSARDLPPDSVEERTNLDEGPVVLQWPTTLSSESVEDLEYWLRGLVRRARRKAGLPPEQNRGED